MTDLKQEVSKEPNDGWRDEVFPDHQFDPTVDDADEFPALVDKNISAVKIRMNPIGKGRIWIDGIELKSTHSVKFSAGIGDYSIVTIEILASVDVGANVYSECLRINEKDSTL